MTKIEWTDATWNLAIVCSKVSPGCAHCYAARMVSRQLSEAWRDEDGEPLAAGGEWTGRVRLLPERLSQPLRWRKPRRVFVCSIADLFHEKVPFEYIAAAFGVMAACPQHTFQILTKRPGRVLEWFSGEWAGLDTTEEATASAGSHHSGLIWDGRGTDRANYSLVANVGDISNRRPWPGWPLPNVWIGVTVESPDYLWRVEKLLEIPAAIRFVSCEPLLGAVEIGHWLHLPPCPQHPGEIAAGWGHLPCDCRPHIEERAARGEIGKLDWVIVGGESGPGARPMHPDWVRSLRDQCQTAGVPFFFKQWGEWSPDMPDGYIEGGCKHIECRSLVQGGPTVKTATPVYRVGKKRAGRLLDGREWHEFPKGEP